MSIDSLTILTRIQQRKHLAVKQYDNNLILLGSGIHRLISSQNQTHTIPFSVECEQDKVTNKLSPHVYEFDSNSLQTFDTKSYNTSAYPKQQYLGKVFRSKEISNDLIYFSFINNKKRKDYLDHQLNMVNINKNERDRHDMH